MYVYEKPVKKEQNGKSSNVITGDFYFLICGFSVFPKFSPKNMYYFYN